MRAHDQLVALVPDVGFPGGLLRVHLGGLVHALGLDHLVAGVPNRPLDVAHLHHAGQIGDGGPLAGIAGVGLDHPVQPLEAAGDGGGAVVARHAGDGQIHLGLGHAIADLVEQGFHLLGRDQFRVIDHRGPLAGIADAGVAHALHALQIARHGGRTVGAVHPGDGDDEFFGGYVISVVIGFSRSGLSIGRLVDVCGGVPNPINKSTINQYSKVSLHCATHPPPWPTFRPWPGRGRPRRRW